MSRFPMQRYPNGWFQVAYSDELEPGQVVPLRYFGRDLVLFRGSDGEARGAGRLSRGCAYRGSRFAA